MFHVKRFGPVGAENLTKLIHPTAFGRVRSRGNLVLLAVRWGAAGTAALELTL